jgi:Uma2 family endonuclease
MATVLTDQTIEERMQEVLARDGLFEVIGGEVVAIERMGTAEIRLAFEIAMPIEQFAASTNAGRCAMELLFDLQLPSGQKRRPDFAFVSSERWPLGDRIPAGEAWNVIPDLAGEILSPSNQAEEIMEKTCEYFAAGVRAVWLVYPRQHILQVYTSPSDVSGYGAGDDVPGEPVLPGFRLSLERLFRNFPKSDPPPSDRPLD